MKHIQNTFLNGRFFRSMVHNFVTPKLASRMSRLTELRSVSQLPTSATRAVPSRVCRWWPQGRHGHGATFVKTLLSCCLETTKKNKSDRCWKPFVHQSPIFVSISSTQIPVVIDWNKHNTGYWTCHHPKLVIRDSHHSRDRSRPVCFCLLILTFVSTKQKMSESAQIGPPWKSLLSFRPCSTCRAQNGHRKSQRRGQVIGRIDRSSGFFWPP